MSHGAMRGPQERSAGTPSEHRLGRGRKRHGGAGPHDAHQIKSTTRPAKQTAVSYMNAAPSQLKQSEGTQQI